MNRCANLPALVLVALLCGAAATRAEPRTLEGRVTRVSDGDSLWLTPAAGPPLEVRLHGLDAPEACQPGGAEARLALEGLVLHRPVTLRTLGRDSYGRLLATVTADGVDVNVRLVEEGHAWSLRFKWDQGPYVKQERMAKALGRGLHGVAGAEMPRDFRRRHGPCEIHPAPSGRAASAARPT